VIKLLSISLVIFLSLFSNGQQPTEKSLRAYFEKADSLSPIEGIWNLETSREFYHYDTLYDVKNLTGPEEVAIIKESTDFAAYSIKGEKLNLVFTTTDVKGVYMYQNYYPLLSDFSKKQAVICTHGKMEYTYDLPEEYAIKECGENYQPNTRVVNVLKWNKVFPNQ
jgi:hypothetical protein